MNKAKQLENHLRLQEINTSLERKLFWLFIICGIVFSHVGLSLNNIGVFTEWSTDGSSVGYLSTDLKEEIFAILGQFLMELGYSLYSNFELFIVIIAIKVILVNPEETTGLNIQTSAKTMARRYCVLSLALFIFIYTQSGTDYLIMLSFAFSFVFILLFVWYILWSKKSRKYGIFTDILMFEDGFLKAFFLLVSIVGIWFVLSSFFVLWFEGEWAYEYYDEEGSLSIFKNFDYMVSTLRTTGIAITVVGILGTIFTFFKTK